MPVSLDALQGLVGSPLDAGSTDGLVASRRKMEASLLAMKRSLELQASDPRHTFSGATNADVDFDQSKLDASPNFGLDAQADTKKVQDTNLAMSTYNRPDVTDQRLQQEATAKALKIAPEEVKNAGDLALENQKAKHAMELEEAQQAPMRGYMDAQMAGAAGGKAMGTPGSFKPSFDTKGRMAMTMVPTPPQELSQQHGATVGLEALHKTRDIVDTLDKHGMLGPVMGRLSTAAVGTGLDALFMSPEASQAFNDFKNQVSLMKSNMAMVHGGARGGSNIGMAQRFDQLVNSAQSAPALRGALDTFERWLTRYANATNSAELDAADAEMGIRPDEHTAHTPGDDLGANWGR